MRARTALLAAATLLVGCGTGDDAPETDAPPAEPAVLDCGSYEAGLGAATSEQETANQCLIEAFDAGRAATLVLTLPTIEGDPVTHTFLVTGPGAVRLEVDATKDAYGGGRETYTCSGLGQTAGKLAWTGCTELEVADPPVTDTSRSG